MTTRYIVAAQERPPCIEVPCSDCGAWTHYVVSDAAFEFYLARYPGEPYRCPTHRIQRCPDAVLYAQAPHRNGRGS
jgi:hypothetical protein